MKNFLWNVMDIGGTIVGGAVVVLMTLYSSFVRMLTRLADAITRPPLDEKAALPREVFPERRTQMRDKVYLHCVVNGLFQGQHTHKNARVMDLSRQYMYIQTRAPFDVGDDIMAEVKATRVDSTFLVLGKVLRKTTTGMAVRFTDKLSSGAEMILTAR
jgi:hypothetical protein